MSVGTRLLREINTDNVILLGARGVPRVKQDGLKNVLIRYMAKVWYLYNIVNINYLHWFLTMKNMKKRKTFLNPRPDLK